MKLLRGSCVFSYFLSTALSIGIILAAVGRACAAEAAVGEQNGTETEIVAAAGGGMSRAWIAMAAAATMGISCLAAGYAVAKVGAAAMGAASEKPEIMGKAMLFVAIAEGIAIYGLIIAVFILTKI